MGVHLSGGENREKVAWEEEKTSPSGRTGKFWSYVPSYLRPEELVVSFSSTHVRRRPHGAGSAGPPHSTNRREVNSRRFKVFQRKTLERASAGVEGGGKAASEAYLRPEELVVSFSSTSWAPPSTMETEDTRVSLALSRSSGMDRAPQLHMVERILARVVAMPSARDPA